MLFCLPEYNIKIINPQIINKSDISIFASVNINSPNKTIRTQITSILFIKIIGICSRIKFVVVPFIVFIKYVYGVSPKGVKIPVNIQQIIKTINIFVFGFLFIIIFELFSFFFKQAIKYSAIYGKYNTNENGHTATCKFATNNEPIIKYIPYFFFPVSNNFSILYI